MINTIYKTLVVGNQKAIVAFIIPLIGGWLLLAGVSLDMTVEEALSVIVISVINAGGVWLKANKE